jgi:beta-lactamase regulating signal transducer with metallopeptidase domain
MDALLLLKASLLLSATLLGARLLRRAPASARHCLWTLAFAAILALPLLTVLVPAIHVPMPVADATIANAVGRFTSRPDVGGAIVPPGDGSAAARVNGAPRVGGDARVSFMDHSEARPSISPGFARPSARAVMLTAWAAGSVAAAAVLLVSLIRVRRLARSAREMDDPSWTASAGVIGSRLALRRPARLLVSPHVGTPMAGGFWRPAIFLPESARGWSAEQREVVLAHELAHLAGHDPLRHVAARLAVAFYWFHPLAWMAARRAVAAREQACDEAVLALGTRPSSYARVLLDLAASMRPSPAGVAALSMVDRSHLETRLMAILNSDSRVAARRSVVIPAVVGAVCTLAVAAAQPDVRATAARGAAGAAAAQSAGAAAAARPATAPLVAVAPKPEKLPAMWLNAAPSQVGADSACEPVMRSGTSFYGTTSSRGDGRIYDMIGSSDSDRVIAKTLGDVRVCMLAERAGPRGDNERPSQWPGRAPRVIMEARRGAEFQRLEITSEGSAQRISWQVGGTPRPFDAAAQQWRDRMLAALDTTWEIMTLRGELSSFRGEISSLRGEESSLRGEMSSLQGEISSMRGQQSSIRGDESSLRGQISSIRGHVSSLRGAISAEQGRISALSSGGFRGDDARTIRDLIAKSENEIRRLEQELRNYNADAKVAAVEREIQKLDSDTKVATIEAEIRKFDLDRKLRELQIKIEQLNVDGKIAVVEKMIASLDADRRQAELEKRRDEELKRLEAAIAAIR